MTAILDLTSESCILEVTHVVSPFLKIWQALGMTIKLFMAITNLQNESKQSPQLSFRRLKDKHKFKFCRHLVNFLLGLTN